MKIAHQEQSCKVVEVVDDILCNQCGLTCRDAFGSNYEGLVEVEIVGGYGSVLGDGTSRQFSICESCLQKMFEGFKIPPKIEGEFGPIKELPPPPQRLVDAFRTHAGKTIDPRVELWLHCCSEHCNIMDPFSSMSTLEKFHNAEHEGPGTIRSHTLESRAYSLTKLGRVLVESDDEGALVVPLKESP